MVALDENPKAVFDGRESSRALKADRAPRFLCCANWIVAPGSSVVGCGGSRRESQKLYWMGVSAEEH